MLGEAREAVTGLWDGVRAMARPYLPSEAISLPPLSGLERYPATAGGRTRAILLEFLADLWRNPERGVPSVAG